MKKISCFIPYTEAELTEANALDFLNSGVVEKVFVVSGKKTGYRPSDMRISVINVSGSFTSAETLMEFATHLKSEYIVLYNRASSIDLSENSLRRMLQVCDDTGSAMVYSGYYQVKNGSVEPHPVIEYQEGSLRDDFDFGSVLLIRSSKFIQACSEINRENKYAGFYDLRLALSRLGNITHIPELLYAENEYDNRTSGEKQFDYVDPRNFAVQAEMEKACTNHLKKAGGWLRPEFRQVDFSSEIFKNEASVIIPVRNRIKTLGDAIKSVLSQNAPFSFNLIIVDNHSTDGTTELIRSFALHDERIIHIVPERNDLGIGGCWNKGISDTNCGKFSIQLDSDDLYINNDVIRRIIDEFYLQNCAMLIGSYRMVNFNLQDIPPGLIDHKEWTPDNGRNNALRINGLGAPRAFFTPVIRQIGFPNVSYGEDYAVGLAISRYYRIGRIFEPLYLCRRWNENSDSSLDVNRLNANNYYKDKIRTFELRARKQINNILL